MLQQLSQSSCRHIMLTYVGTYVNILMGDIYVGIWICRRICQHSKNVWTYISAYFSLLEEYIAISMCWYLCQHLKVSTLYVSIWICQHICQHKNKNVGIYVTIFSPLVMIVELYSFPRRNWLRKGTELIIDIHLRERFVKVYLRNVS